MTTEGKHIARAVEWGLGTASTGTEQIAVLFDILQGPDAGERITWYGFFTEKTWERTVESLRACGWTGSDLSVLDGLDANDVQLVVENEQNDQGQIYPRVRWVNKVGGGLGLKQQLEPAAARTFAQRMRGQILAFDQENGKPKPASKPANTPLRSVPSRSGSSRSSGAMPPEPPPIADDPRYSSRPSSDDIPF